MSISLGCFSDLEILQSLECPTWEAPSDLFRAPSISRGQGGVPRLVVQSMSAARRTPEDAESSKGRPVTGYFVPSETPKTLISNGTLSNRDESPSASILHMRVSDCDCPCRMQGESSGSDVKEKVE